MMKSVLPHESSRTETRVIRLTTDQEAVLQEQFNRWPKNPHKADVVLLAAETGLSEEDVQVSQICYFSLSPFLCNYFGND